MRSSQVDFSSNKDLLGRPHWLTTDTQLRVLNIAMHTAASWKQLHNPSHDEQNNGLSAIRIGDRSSANPSGRCFAGDLLLLSWGTCQTVKSATYCISRVYLSVARSPQPYPRATYLPSFDPTALPPFLFHAQNPPNPPPYTLELTSLRHLAFALTTEPKLGISIPSHVDPLY